MAGTTTGQIGTATIREEGYEVKKKTIRYFWMAVTSDKYEFPLHIEHTAKALGERMGITAGAVYSMEYLKKDGSLSGRKIVKVINEDGDQT